ncbi:MAG TPA: 16S rRNA (cytosine(967)-C(5))-methyltransferase RsmB [Nitrospiraceae bacterium]|jgi:16S rRNA (cytosine967-C5)-methyltransferase|nr:16S rRNA (cytosine(967)-C(5))-methyltransferase RsmB [Nitrospiraceae bacterium]
MKANPDLGHRSSLLAYSGSRLDARSTALRALIETELKQIPADEALGAALRHIRQDSRERALATELTYGVLRRRGMIDWRLTQVMDRPIERLPAVVKTALRLGAYQLLYLDTIPDSAAVHESVQIVKLFRARLGRDWSGFVNAVLRTLLRTAQPAWPDAATHPVAALAVRYSCPEWLVRRWLERFGPSQAERLCRTVSEIPPLTIRVNTLRISREALIEWFARAGIDARATAVSPVGIVLDKCGSVTELPGFRTGAFYVEDEAGQLIPLLLDPQPGERVLDACAAPGGKTTHLAALMQNRGEIIAVDRSPQRIRKVEDNCRRLGVSIVRSVVADARQLAMMAERRERGRNIRTLPFNAPFDRILLDVPCSGLGVLRRHPEAKWRKQAARLERHQRLQRELLEAVSALLRPGGVLVYSTCSTETEENEQVIESFCQAHAEFRRESVGPWLPPTGLPLLTSRGDLFTMLNEQAMDVFFAARLRRVA